MAKSKTVDPTQPPSMIKDVLAKKKEHRLAIIAAGVALFGFIALIPAMAAAVAIVSLVADPEILVSEAESALEAAPDETRMFLVAQLRNIAEDGTGAGIAAVLGVAGAVYSASGALGHFMEGLNLVFDRTETRSFIVKKLTAVSLMLGALILLAATVFAMTVVPALVSSFIDSSAISNLINIGRFPVLLLVLIAGLSLFFRFGPAPQSNRPTELVPGGRPPLITKGGAAAAILALVISAVFGWIAGNFGNYGETYGTLATIIVVLLWLQYLALAILLGAEVEAHLRRKKVFDARASAGLPPIRVEAPTELAA